MLIELNRVESLELLKNKSIGRIGCSRGSSVYVVPINYQLTDSYITCYSLEGKKIDMMRSQPDVCFQVDEILDSNNWKSVMVNGTFEEIVLEQELAELRPLYNEYWLRNKVEFTLDKKPEAEISPPHGAQVYFRILIKEISGRQQQGF